MTLIYLSLKLTK